MQGTILWFNEAKDCGVILTEEGERLEVAGSGFAGGVRPKGRCAHAAVSFEVIVDKGERSASGVVLVEEERPRRARLRHRGAAR